MTENVVLVDEQDREVGVMEKLEAHRKGVLHRAISVFVFNPSGELILQQRAMNKYHGGGLWTNTCCSHPYPGEAPLDAAHRRLKEEMGFETDLQFSHCFIYNADVGNGLLEHELDHVFTGIYSGTPALNPAEAMAWRPISMDALRQEVNLHPSEFSAWLRIILEDPAFILNHVA